MCSKTTREVQHIGYDTEELIGEESRAHAQDKHGKVCDEYVENVHLSSDAHSCLHGVKRLPLVTSPSDHN